MYKFVVTFFVGSLCWYQYQQALIIDVSDLYQKSMTLIQTHMTQKGITELYQRASPVILNIVTATVVTNILLPNSFKRRIVTWPLIGRFIFYRASKKVVAPVPQVSIECSQSCETKALMSLTEDVRRMSSDIDVIARYLKFKPISEYDSFNIGSYQPPDSNQSLGTKLDALCSQFSLLQKQIAMQQK